MAQGELSLTVLEAEYDEVCVDGEPNTYFALILLESVRWRRRKSKRQSGLNPRFNETFVFEDVSSDSKVRRPHAHEWQNDWPLLVLRNRPHLRQ